MERGRFEQSSVGESALLFPTSQTGETGLSALLVDGGTVTALDAGIPDEMGYPHKRREIALEMKRGRGLALSQDGMIPAIPGFYDAVTPDSPFDQSLREWRYAPPRPVAGIIGTHFHTDHMGALPQADPRIPLYASPLTRAMLRAVELEGGNPTITQTPMRNGNCYDERRFVPMRHEKPVTIGGLDGLDGLVITPLEVDHAVGSMAYRIKTRDGKIVHWISDVASGPKTERALRQLLREESTALLVDFTNVVDPKTVDLDGEKIGIPQFNRIIEEADMHSGPVFLSIDKYRLDDVIRVLEHSHSKRIMIPASMRLYIDQAGKFMLNRSGRNPFDNRRIEYYRERPNSSYDTSHVTDAVRDVAFDTSVWDARSIAPDSRSSIIIVNHPSEVGHVVRSGTGVAMYRDSLYIHGSRTADIAERTGRGRKELNEVIVRRNGKLHIYVRQNHIGHDELAKIVEEARTEFVVPLHLEPEFIPVAERMVKAVNPKAKFFLPGRSEALRM